MFRFSLLFSLCVVSFIGWGCATAPREEKNYYQGKYQQMVEILDPGLAQEIYISQVSTSEKRQGLLRVAVPFFSQTGRPIRIEAQTLYFTAKGEPLYQGSEAKQPWLMLSVKAIGTNEYFSQSIHPAARYFLVRFRYAPGQKSYRERRESLRSEQETFLSPRASSAGSKR